MKITKLGHCCLLVQEAGTAILTDPGAWTSAQNELSGIQAVLITHEHQDHFHIESVKKVLKNNPEAKIYTNRGVGKILDEQGIAYRLLEDGQSAKASGVLVEGHGTRHAHIYSTIPEVLNTGYFIGGRFFYGGDAFYNPGRKVDILALPVAGPWLKISEAIDFCKEIKPRHCFPVHDGMLKINGPFHMVPKRALAESGIDFVLPKEGEAMDF